MLMKKFYLFFITTLFSVMVFAQNKQITGTVTSSENQSPLLGTTVTVKGTKISVATNSQGQFTISVPVKATTLVISNSGFLSKEVSILNISDIKVQLVTDVKDLEDVVVIGYQTISRKNLLASVSSVSSKDLKDISINSAGEALNGRLAGVTATTAEGSPDAQINIRVRGGISITQDNSPLYIVDGVQVENGLAAISPQDIQSIDVLKDAAATAIYGARAGNGVIIITTKVGKQGKLRMSYNSFIGIKNLANKLDVMSPYDFVVYQSERSRGNSTDSISFTKNYGSTWDTLNVYKNIGVVDWQKEAFGRTGVMQTHNISGNGGSASIKYNFGYTYNDDKAIVLNSSYKRHLLNFKADYTISKKLKIGIGTRYTNQVVYGAGVSSDGGTSFNRLRNVIKYRPFLSTNQTILDQDPYADPAAGNGLILVNPILLINSEYRKKATSVFNFNGNISYKISKNLTFKSTFGFDKQKIYDLKYSDSLTPLSRNQGAAKPVAGLDSTEKTTFTNSNVLTYSIKGYKKYNNFDFLLGEETYDLRVTNSSQLYGNFANFTPHDAAFQQLSLGTSYTGYPRLNKTRYTSLSFFGRLNYAYKEKYLLSLNVRFDGTSKFGPGHKWGSFPAASAAWRVSKEKFMKDVKFIDDMKFRVGVGKIGNNRINDYLYSSTYSNTGTYYYGLNNVPINGYYSTSLVNSELLWESTVNKNFGIDLTLFNRKVDLTIDIYDNTSDNLLLNVPVASTYGYPLQLQNIGKTSNRGVDVQLNSTLIKNKNFSWNANFNISVNKNEILQLGQNQNYFYPDASWGVSGQPTDYIAKIGSPVGSMWGLVNDGFYKLSDFDYNGSTGAYTLKTGVVDGKAIIGVVQPGSIKFKDLNGDGVVDFNNDRTIIGNPTPKFTGGFNQQFTYKNWDMSLFVNFSYGNDIYNANKIELSNAYVNNGNMLNIMANRWRTITADGQNAQWVKGTTAYGLPPDQLQALNGNATIWQAIKSNGAFTPSSWAIEDGSFLRFNNFTLGYSLPIKTLIKLHMSKLRFYFTANNFALITKYTGYDPEVSVRNSGLTPGLDYSAYPKSRTFIFGLNATF